jgi:hypothetical protein
VTERNLFDTLDKTASPDVKNVHLSFNLDST